MMRGACLRGLRFSSLLSVAVWISAPSTAPVRADTCLYVVSRETNRLVVIDAATFRIGGSIRVGEFPEGIVARPDGEQVFVANSRSSSISVVSTVTHEVVDTIITPPADESGLPYHPRQLAVSPDGTSLYVTLDYDDSCAFESTLAVVDVTRPLLGNFLGVLGEATIEDLAITGDGKSLHSSVGGGCSDYPYFAGVSLFDARDGVAPRLLVVAENEDRRIKSRGVAIAPDGMTSYATIESTDTLVVADVLSGNIIAQIEVGTQPRGVTVAPDGAVYVANRCLDPTCVNGGSVSVVDPALAQVVATISVPDGANRIAVDADGERLYVTHPGSVSEVDASSRMLIGNVEVGGVLDRIVMASVPGSCAARVCAGDCNYDDLVSIDELVSSIAIAIGSMDLSACDAADRDGNGSVDVAEVVDVLQGALSSCP
jgi:YVTN family beta-propeller protein